MFLVNTPRQVGAYPRPVQDLIYKDGAAPTVTNLISPTGTAKKVKGGYLISGRWVWCTTIQFTDWVSMFAQVEDENGKRGPMRMFLAPNTPENVTIVETWEAHGMAGTGTHHVVADDVFVADDMTPGDHKGEFAWGRNSTEVFPDYPVMHAPAAPFGAVCIAATVTAAANGAVEQTRRRLASYNKRGSTVPEKEKMSQQMRLSRASVLATASMLLVQEGARLCCEKLTGDNAQDLPEFYQVQAMSGEAAEIARQVVTMLMQSGGTSVHYLSSPIGRHFRDVFTGASHASVDYDPTIQMWGQKMLGVLPNQRLQLGDRNLVRDELAATKDGNYERTSSETHTIRAI
jgi:alkylation response protein AidB-like acyl-CoA dehydrogenase